MLPAITLDGCLGAMTAPIALVPKEAGWRGLYDGGGPDGGEHLNAFEPWLVGVRIRWRGGAGFSGGGGSNFGGKDGKGWVGRVAV